jgi:hypothetical protein
MSRKKILPKKLGPLKIPKNLRRLGDKALSDPQVVGIVSGALASVGGLVAARKAVADGPGEAALTQTGASRRVVGSVADVVGRALEDSLHARQRAKTSRGADTKKGAKKNKTRSANDDVAQEPDGEQLH